MTSDRLVDIQPTREKLQLLEQTYEAARLDPTGSDHVRELELRSIKQLINQFKEEIIRHECSHGREAAAESRELRDEFQVEVTRSKLKLLEEQFEASRMEPSENPRLKQLSQRSLKRMINQLTEEIVRFESRMMNLAAK